MGYMTAPPSLVDLDGDNLIDGVLMRIKDGTGITLSLSNNVLTIGTSGGVAYYSDGAPSNDDGENLDVNIDYTNGDIYRKSGGAWSIFEQIPSLRRLMMFTSTYHESSFVAGKFGPDDGKYYFHYASFPGAGSVANAETYLDNLHYNYGTRLIFQQIDNHDNVTVYRVSDTTRYTNGDAGYDAPTLGTDHVGLVLTKESGVSFTEGSVYNIHITQPVNFLFDSSGNATISADLTIKEFILTTASRSTSSTNTTTIDTWPKATYRSAKYEYQITNTSASEYQIGEIMVVHDGSNSKRNEYGVIFTGASPLGTFSTDVSAGQSRLRFTAISSDAMTVKIARKAIKI